MSLRGVRTGTSACPNPQRGAKQPGHTGAPAALGFGPLLGDMISLRLGWDTVYGWPGRAGLWGVGSWPCSSVTGMGASTGRATCKSPNVSTFLLVCEVDSCKKEILGACYHFHVLKAHKNVLMQ